MLRRVFEPGFGKLGGVSGGIPETAGPSERLEDGEVDNGC